MDKARQPTNAKTGPRPVTDRLPPHSAEAEQGVLGCILLNPAECLPDTIALLRRGEALYDVRHQAVYALLVEMHDKQLPIDLITVQQRLKDRQQLEAVGGLPYLASLPDAASSAANLGYYVEIVRQKYLLRRMIQVCTEAVGRVYEHGGEIEPLLDETEQEILALREDHVGFCNWSVKSAVRAAIREIEASGETDGRTDGLTSGFVDFDHLTSGFRPEQMVVIAGRPSSGKSSWALNVADHLAVEEKVPVGYFSFEMSTGALMKRALAARSRVNLRWLRDGIANDATRKLSQASGQLAGAPLFIDDQPSQNIIQVCSKARQMQRKHGIKLLVIDYLQLLHGHPGKRYRSDAEELTDVSSRIKELARELKIPVIVLSQLNREVDRDRKNRKPRMSDLRGSGSLEQDADVIGLLYRASRENRHKPAEDDGEHHGEPAVPVNMLVDKNRDGETRDIHFTFLKSITRFESAAKISNDHIQQEHLPYKDT